MRDQLTTVLTSLAGCTGSRDLDLSVLMSQLGALDPPAPHQQGIQLSPAPASTSSKGGAGPLQLWQHPQQHSAQQQDPQQQQQQIRPWCETCGRSYSTVGNLKQHVANVHGRGEWVTCGVCGKTFKTRQYLQSHLLQQHGIRQRPTPLLPGPSHPSHHDPTQLPFPHESPSSSAQASTFSPVNRPFQSQTSAVNPSLPQPSVPAAFNNTIQSATDFANTTLNGHAHLPTFNQSSSSTSTSYSTSQNRNPNSALGPAPPQPDSSGQAASPPPQQVKQERFNGFNIKQEISHDNYYAI